MKKNSFLIWIALAGVLGLLCWDNLSWRTAIERVRWDGKIPSCIVLQDENGKPMRVCNSLFYDP